MVSAPHPSANREKSAVAGSLGSVAHTDLVNSGRDTRITFSDGSTIVLKGVIQPKEVFAPPAPQPRS